VSTVASNTPLNLADGVADLDRSNLGNARLQGLPQDALGGDASGHKFAWVNTAFFIAYVCASLRGLLQTDRLSRLQIIFQIPCSLMAKVVSPRIWISCSAIGWGICSTLMVCLEALALYIR
jgi:hypothetical protein